MSTVNTNMDAMAHSDWSRKYSLLIMSFNVGSHFLSLLAGGEKY